jgi:hypothetical protein
MNQKAVEGIYLPSFYGNLLLSRFCLYKLGNVEDYLALF